MAARQGLSKSTVSTIWRSHKSSSRIGSSASSCRGISAFSRNSPMWWASI